MDADASGDVVAVLPDVDIDFDLDGFDFDLDLIAAEFCAGDDYFLPAEDKKGAVDGLDLDLGSSEGGGGGGGGREGSPDSDVTDGPLASGDGSMSAYVSELERFLMEDGDDAAEDYFGDLLTDDSGVPAAADAGGNPTAAAEEENLTAHEDEATSRKRARQRRGSALIPSEEFEVPRRHGNGIPIEYYGCRRLRFGPLHYGVRWLST